MGSVDYFDESHRILRQTLAKFVEKEIKPHVEEWEEAGGFPRELYRRAGEVGLLGVGYPEEYGGSGGDVFHMIVAIEELIRCGSGGVAAGLGTHGIAIPPILAMGTEEQKKRFVPPVLSGEKVAALGITEPGAGSDVASIRTRAVRDGDGYVVNGSKTFISSGARADIVTLAVRTGGPGPHGVSLLVVETDTPGFVVSRQLKKMGWWASDTAELAFEDMRVPEANLLGQEGQGFYGIMHNFQMERLTLAVMSNVTAELALQESIKYAKAREAFGRTLAGFQVIRHKLVEMAMLVDVAREYAYRVAAKVNAGLDAVTEVSMAKIFSADACAKVCDAAVQIHGGYGFMREYLVERLYRDSRILSIGGGTSEIMKEVISKRML
ncbi:MAG: acyl-CoA dehydrogenase family protein [Thermodesulfobacteriota bacterium]